MYIKSIGRGAFHRRRMVRVTDPGAYGKANVSRSTFYKLKNGENVTTDILLRICDALDCDISEIMECIKND